MGRGAYVAPARRRAAYADRTSAEAAGPSLKGPAPVPVNKSWADTVEDNDPLALDDIPAEWLAAVQVRGVLSLLTACRRAVQAAMLYSKCIVALAAGHTCYPLGSCQSPSARDLSAFLDCSLFLSFLPSTAFNPSLYSSCRFQRVLRTASDCCFVALRPTAPGAKAMVPASRVPLGHPLLHPKLQRWMGPRPGLPSCLSPLCL